MVLKEHRPPAAIMVILMTVFILAGECYLLLVVVFCYELKLKEPAELQRRCVTLTGNCKQCRSSDPSATTVSPEILFTGELGLLCWLLNRKCKKGWGCSDAAVSLTRKPWLVVAPPLRLIVALFRSLVCSPKIAI